MFPSSANTSGTFLFNPSNNEVIAQAFSRIRIRRAEILSQHIQDAVMELNVLFARMDNMGPNLWTVDLQNFAMVQGTATYSVPGDTIQVLDVFIRTGSGNTTNDRILYSLSRTEYASLSNKTQQGFPSQFWYDRLISPTLTFYLTPDSNGPYTVYYYRFRQIQDAMIANGQNPEVPVRWFDAIIAGLAHRLARIYAPELEPIRKTDADEAWSIAATQDVEDTPLTIMPMTGGYFRY